MSVKGADGDYTYMILSKFTYIRKLQMKQPNEGQAISNDPYWKDIFDWAIVILLDIVL